MLRSIQYAPNARRDLLIQADEYRTRATPDTAKRFLQAVANTAQLLQTAPGIGTIVATSAVSKPLRRITVVGPFTRWLLFYTVTQTSIRIERVLDGSRDLSGVYP